ncbi:MAG TPA: hypothetical protein PKK06_00905 [Phycisphaerae bacterium]|nr:hypothetical protein [Phycisphaerae bacterium]HNU43832.1 hypothetical protein [Phycisphaerae bacterium]
MSSKERHLNRPGERAVDRFAAKLLALFDDADQPHHLPADQQQAIHNEIVSVLDQLGEQAFPDMLRRLYELAGRQARGRSHLRGRTRRSFL